MSQFFYFQLNDPAEIHLSGYRAIAARNTKVSKELATKFGDNNKEWFELETDDGHSFEEVFDLYFQTACGLDRNGYSLMDIVNEICIADALIVFVYSDLDEEIERCHGIRELWQGIAECYANPPVELHIAMQPIK